MSVISLLCRQSKQGVFGYDIIFANRCGVCIRFHYLLFVLRLVSLLGKDAIIRLAKS
jgi:hypothetical protein